MFELRRARRKADIAAAELQVAQIEARAKGLKSNTFILDTHDQVLEALQSQYDRLQSNLFDLQNYSTADAIDEATDIEMVRKSYKLYATDSFAHGWIELLVHFIVGSECQLKAKGGEQAQKILDEFGAGEQSEYRVQSPWVRVAQEFVRRTFRDGRCGLRKFPSDEGKLYTRFLNPLRILNNGEYGERGSFGIVTAVQDIQQVQFYIYAPQQYAYSSGARQTSEIIPAREVVFAKINDDDCKTGRPLLLPLMADLIDYNRLVFANLKKNWLRSLCYREETYEGLTDEEIQAIHARLKKDDVVANARYEKVPVSGSVDRHGAGVKVEYKTPNVGNEDTDYCFRRVGLRFVVALGLTEGMVLGDAKQQNYHGSEIHETVAVRTIKSWQWGFFSPYFRRVGEDVLKTAKDAGRLDKNADTSVEVDFPLVLDRELKTQTEALILQGTTEIDGEPIASLDTIRTALDLDGLVERKKIEAQKKNALKSEPTAQDELAAALATGNNGGKKGEPGANRLGVGARNRV